MSKEIWAEVVTIGSELVLGQLVDTNAAFIAQRLSEIGVGLAYHTTVGDDRERMAEVMKLALSRADIVITTGGIGPTEDDLTREVAAEVLGRDLVMREDLLVWIKGLFQRMNVAMAPNNQRQACIPDGAEVIHNPRGTAPAFRYEVDGHVLICLPGVPHETEFLLRETVIPYLVHRFLPAGRVWVNRVLKVGAMGESTVDEQIKEIIRTSTNPIIGLQAAPSDIKIRLTARAETREKAEVLLDDGERRIRDILGPMIYGVEDETLAGNVHRLLTEQGLTLAVADNCSRGMLVAELGRELKPERLVEARVVSGPATAAELSGRLGTAHGADITLIVAGRPAADGRLITQIRVMDRDGKGPEKELTLGGAGWMVPRRAGTMGLFTLYRFLADRRDGVVTA